MSRLLLRMFAGERPRRPDFVIEPVDAVSLRMPLLRVLPAGLLKRGRISRRSRCCARSRGERFKLFFGRSGRAPASSSSSTACLFPISMAWCSGEFPFPSWTFAFRPERRALLSCKTALGSEVPQGKGGGGGEEGLGH